MVREEQLLSLVGRVYDAALAPAAWPAFLEELAETLDGQVAIFGFARAEAPQLSIQSIARADPESIRLYNAHYGERDPWLLRGFARGFYQTGATGVSEQLVPKSEYVRTEFYADFGERWGIESAISGVIRRDQRSVAMVNVCSRRLAPYEAEHIALMRALVPHLQRALQLHTRLTNLEAERSATAEIFDRLALATVLLDETGAVAFVNGAASELLSARDGLGVQRGVLSAASARDAAALGRLTAQAIATTRGEELHAGGALAISRPSGKRPYVALVTPLRSANEYAPHGRAAAAVFVTDPESEATPDETLLRAAFGLTRAESRVAMRIAQGQRFSDVTQELGIGAATGRTHLRNVFAKTGTRTQAQFVRLVSAALAPLRRGPERASANGRRDAVNGS
ncbi:MAG TPA: hypothetical protein VFT98_10910 [Myxococcota bacterium]|nr:hypothetical protein [Myxococcota bacterium]